jgi:hypothetical protein
VHSLLVEPPCILRHFLSRYPMSCPWPALEAFQEANATGNLSGAARLCSCIMSNGSVVSRSTPSTVDTAKSCGVSSASSFTKRKPVRYSERVVEKPTNRGRIRAVPQQGRCPIRKRKRADYFVIRQSPRFLFNAPSRMQKSRKLIRAAQKASELSSAERKGRGIETLFRPKPGMGALQ